MNAPFKKFQAQPALNMAALFLYLIKSFPFLASQTDYIMLPENTSVKSTGAGHTQIENYPLCNDFLNDCWGNRQD